MSAGAIYEAISIGIFIVVLLFWATVLAGGL